MSQDLGARVIHNKPKSPKQFLLTELKSRASNKSSAFVTATDLQTLFDMHAVGGKMTPAECRVAASKLGFSTAPSGLDGVDGVDKDAFVRAMQSALF